MSSGTIAGLTFAQWMSLLGLILVSLLVGFLARQLATLALRARYKVPGLVFSDRSKKGTRRAVALLVASGIWLFAVPTLPLPQSTSDLLMRIAQLIATASAVWLMASLWDAGCDLILHRAQAFDQRAERLLIPVTRNFVTALIVVGGLLAVLAVVGVNVYGILASLGIGGLVVALAAKDSVENVFGSLTILFDMPFALGDWVKIDKVEGIVEKINLRSTKIRTFEDSVITLPNSNLIKAAVENFGARRHRRQKFTLRFLHDSDGERVQGFADALRNYLQTQPGVIADKTIVELNEITELWIGVLVICFLETDSSADEMRIRSHIMAEVLSLARLSSLRFSAASPPPSPSDQATIVSEETALPKVE